MFIYLSFVHRYITVYRHNMTFEMSLFFWNFGECNVYCSFVLLISLCLLSTPLALAMLTYVSHANKALEFHLIERERDRD